MFILNFALFLCISATSGTSELAFGLLGTTGVLIFKVLHVLLTMTNQVLFHS